MTFNVIYFVGPKPNPQHKETMMPAVLGPFYVQYPSETDRLGWSPWQFCTIDVNDDGTVTRIALLAHDTPLPLAGLHKLRVFDPEQKMESEQRYCLGIHGKVLYKFCYTKTIGKSAHSSDAGLRFKNKTQKEAKVAKNQDIIRDSKIGWDRKDRITSEMLYSNAPLDSRLQFTEAEYNFLYNITLQDMPGQSDLKQDIPPVAEEKTVVVPKEFPTAYRRPDRPKKMCLYDAVNEDTPLLGGNRNADDTDDADLDRAIELSRQLYRGTDTSSTIVDDPELAYALEISQQSDNPVPNSFAKLAQTIARIDQQNHKSIHTHAEAILNNLEILDAKNDVILTPHIQSTVTLTNRLLLSQPGKDDRARLIQQYRNLALNFTSAKDLFCNKMGRLMMVLGGLIAGVGAVCFLSAGGWVPAVIAVVGVSSGLAGFGLFRDYPLTPLTQDMQHLASDTENSQSCVV